MIKLQRALLLVLIVICFGPVWGGEDDVDRWNPPMDLVATLPKMCWGFFKMANVPDTPEYNVLLSCGVWSNHYCPGLVRLKAAAKAKTKQKREEYLVSAKKEMEYTLRNVKEVPECSVLPIAKSNLDFINLELQVLKGQKYGR